MNLIQRSYQAELLDADDIPFPDIRRNMHELDVINRWLGGHRITIKGLQQLLNGRRQVHICEIGCGGGDNLQALLQWCRRKHIAVTFTGIDIKDSCIDYATQRSVLTGHTRWIVSDYRDVRFTEKPDILFSSLFCHHFTNETLVDQLQWMQQHCSMGFFINDLHRHWLAYHSIRILTQLFSRSYLVKNDAPLSVARGFTRQEWQSLLQQAGLRKAQVKWQWAFRHLVTWQQHV
ncbi:methyltransferase domain-containing protein [Chitinophaga agrisoli]|uniref:Methyltransferase domain-containing protein n=1 Tax=Chitinophaga agrisoli TaxID=2607653 RepID=A0A5B2VWJ6_9BACT|nr:methyltransferase domain-containing protein [Chitinophaga agrisoli]KAA2243020.1 methyltransferase domain-containing protein [Chitinophaga agrisoli]